MIDYKQRDLAVIKAAGYDIRPLSLNSEESVFALYDEKGKVVLTTDMDGIEAPVAYDTDSECIDFFFLKFPEKYPASAN